MNSTIRILLKSPKVVFGLILLACILVLMFAYPLINRGDPLEMVSTGFANPDAQYVLGTDNFGRDVLLELMYGTRTSLYIGLIAGVIATAIGLTLGLFAGYVGGIVDNIISTINNMFIVIPSFIVLILISVSLNTRSAAIIGVIIGLTNWPWTARAVRAQTTSLRLRDHVNIAKISGYSTPRIILSEILPYIASYVVMAFIIQINSGILYEATISMLGLGPFNTISLGIMLNWAIMFEATAAGAWWAFIPPALIVTAVTFSLFSINTGMDEIFNPKIRS